MRVLCGGSLIQFVYQLAFGAIFFGENSGSGLDDRERIIGIERELDPVVKGTKVIGLLDFRDALVLVFSEKDELRKIFVQRSQTIMNP